jgi:hypothetical protein
VREVGSLRLVIVLDLVGHLKPSFGLGCLPDVVPLETTVLAVEILAGADNLRTEALAHEMLRGKLTATDASPSVAAMRFHNLPP